MQKTKWISLAALLAAGTTLMPYGCLSAFWRGLTTGWPSDHGWMNLAVDVANKAIFG